MPQFDLANASISAQGLANLKAHEAFVPFVYDDGYPVLQDDGRHLYVDNDPVPSGTGIYTAHATFKGRVPYDPLFHKAIRGTLTVGYGHTFDGIPGKDDLYYQVYENGILIDGTTYTSISKLTTKKQRKHELIELIGGGSCDVNDYASRLLEQGAA